MPPTALVILAELQRLPAGQLVMLKLTLPDKDDLYAEFVNDPKVVRVVALSGGYARAEGNELLRKNHGVVASFSRALVEGLSAQQSDAELTRCSTRPFAASSRHPTRERRDALSEGRR